MAATNSTGTELTEDDLYKQINALLGRFYLTSDQLNFVSMEQERGHQIQTGTTDKVGIIYLDRGGEQSTMSVMDPARSFDPYLVHDPDQFNYRRYLLQWSNIEGAMFFYPVEGKYVEMANNFWYEHMTETPSDCPCDQCTKVVKSQRSYG